MSNLQNISLRDFINSLSKAAPILLTLCALLSFIAVGIVCFDYYNELFKVRFGSNSIYMAILASAIQEFVRFGLLMASIKDFSEKKSLNGWIGLTGSAVLVWHDLSLSSSIAQIWSIENASAYESILWFLILVGLLLEIRLVLTVSSSNTTMNKDASTSTNTNLVDGSTPKKEPIQSGV